MMMGFNIFARRKADTQFPRDNEHRKKIWLHKKAERNRNPISQFPLIVYGWEKGE